MNLGERAALDHPSIEADVSPGEGGISHVGRMMRNASAFEGAERTGTTRRNGLGELATASAAAPAHYLSITIAHCCEKLSSASYAIAPTQVSVKGVPLSARKGLLQSDGLRGFFSSCSTLPPSKRPD
jgi:hypothetical protein